MKKRLYNKDVLLYFENETKNRNYMSFSNLQPLIQSFLKHLDYHHASYLVLSQKDQNLFTLEKTTSCIKHQDIPKPVLENKPQLPKTVEEIPSIKPPTQPEVIKKELPQDIKKETKPSYKVEKPLISFSDIKPIFQKIAPEIPIIDSIPTSLQTKEKALIILSEETDLGFMKKLGKALDTHFLKTYVIEEKDFSYEILFQKHSVPLILTTQTFFDKQEKLRRNTKILPSKKLYINRTFLFLIKNTNIYSNSIEEKKYLWNSLKLELSQLNILWKKNTPQSS